jgi:cytochrome P450
MVGDPELMRLILGDKKGDLVKTPLNPLAGKLNLGLSNLEGERWAKHRRLITPAFHLEKLKVPPFIDTIQTQHVT